MKKLHKNGFTLVELSIVLVIIGLLVGGVLQGRELIEASKRQSMIADLTSYQVALNTFRLQYNALAGDFDEASDYWTECVDGGATTCNGNGDGKADTGKIFGVNSALESTGCAGEWTGSVASADYDLASNADNCRMVYFLD